MGDAFAIKETMRLSVLAPLMLVPTMVSAQDPPAQLDTIVVQGSGALTSTEDEYFAPMATTATKTDTPVIEIPQSISTITREQLNDQTPQTVREALNYTSGVLSGIDTTSRYDSVFMRGFGGFGTSTNVVDFLDGLRLPRGQAFALPAVDPYLLDRVDVLKGPSAVLYGQSSPGGLVNQVSRAPSAATQNEVRVEGGSYGRLQGGFTSRGAIDEAGTFQYAITGIGRDSGTRYDDVDEQRLGLAPALTWEPGADTRLTVRGFIQDDPDGGYFNSIYPTFLAPEAYKPYLNPELNVGDPTYDYFDRQQYGIGYAFDHRFNEAFAVSSDLRYSTIDLDFRSLQMMAPLTPNGLLPRQALRSIEDVQGVSMDNHATFDVITGPVGHEILTGFDYQHSTSNWEYQFGLAPSLNVVDPQYGVSVGPLATIIDNRQTLQQAGLYVQDQLSLGNLRAVLGARYDWTDQETHNRLTNTTSDQSSGSPSYRAALLYMFDNGLAPYVSYSTSFEPVIGVDAAGNSFVPTEAQQWEVGVKYEPTFMDALFTASGFDIHQQNVLTPGSMPGFSVQQGEIRSRGLEFEGRGNLLPNLEVIGALTFLDTEVTESTNPAAIGNRPQGVPEYFASVWAEYMVDRGPLTGLSIGGGVRFVGSSFADDANTISTPGYTVVDAALKYDFGNINPTFEGARATFKVTNLLDEEYYGSCSSNYYCQFGNGTQFLVGLQYEW
ncbi:TonB-dependent siderophore receptor [Amorphus sp. 3PC139-8]|uniref:TonB-dependent siderophore receptor n=1 Tax=Amorphus sp. 3PC139-8 TaxID=2735676 RepID=UPI00345CA374